MKIMMELGNLGGVYVRKEKREWRLKETLVGRKVDKESVGRRLIKGVNRLVPLL